MLFQVSIWDYVVVLKDYRVLLLAMHYSACFGTELCVTQEIVSYFTDNFGLSLELAGALGFGFGAMNLFARSLGGILARIRRIGSRRFGANAFFMLPGVACRFHGNRTKTICVFDGCGAQIVEM